MYVPSFHSHITSPHCPILSSLLKLRIRNPTCLSPGPCSLHRRVPFNYGNKKSSSGHERSLLLRSRVLNLLIYRKRKSSETYSTARTSSLASYGRLEKLECVFSSFILTRALTVPQQNFPTYAAGFGRRFLTGSSAASGSVSRRGSDGSLWRDTYGFRKLLVVASSTGKVFGIDTVRGDIVWSRLLVEGSHGGSVKPFKLFSLTTVSDGRQPEIVLLAHRQSPSVSTALARSVSF
jgi:hypothetical protein